MKLYLKLIILDSASLRLISIGGGDQIIDRELMQILYIII